MKVIESWHYHCERKGCDLKVLERTDPPGFKVEVTVWKGHVVSQRTEDHEPRPLLEIEAMKEFEGEDNNALIARAEAFIQETAGKLLGNRVPNA